jgi:glycosyltransferase involved in cell wall biosynthesis
MSGPGPRVSVLIPCFNAERWIGAAIESVYRQTWQDVEIVIVNDGSTDNSLAEINRQKSDRMKVIDQPNRGQNASLNRCLFESTGTFIQYLDADDALEQDKIRNQMIRLEQRPDCIATSAWRVIATAAPVDFVDPAPVKTGPFGERTPVDWLVENWWEGGGMMYPAMWLIPVSILRRVGPWRDDVTLMNDTEFFSRVVLASQAVLLCPESLSYYRKGHPSLSNVKTARAWRSYFHVMELCVDRLLAAESSDRTRRVASFMWQRLANSCYPYQRALGVEAQRRAELLHSDRLYLPAGRYYNLISEILGWKIARTLQVLSGRN